LADVIVPRTERLAAETIADRGLAGAIADAGLAMPVLVRPVASHGGEGLVLARDAEDLAATAAPTGSDVYVTRFHDYRSPDGYHRKYRMIFVDRRPHAYHLGIGEHWMVHHQTSGMEADEARQAEELAFLRDPTAAIGARAMAAVTAIGGRLDLDYGGIDFAVTQGGQVLVFEANATMLTHLEPEDGPFAAKNPFIRPIIAAFQGHLARLAGSS
jgi:glutathione synthase/RimK-type ligase-like ATP-grasp enzyme